MSRQGGEDLSARKLWLLVGIMKYAKEIDQIDTGFYFWVFILYAAFQGLNFSSHILISVRSKPNMSVFWISTRALLPV